LRWQKRFCFDYPPFFGYVFPFFACAKKGTKKAQPILMLTQFSVEHFLCQNRHQEHNAVEQF
jgi:hypothetical protein